MLHLRAWRMLMKFFWLKKCHRNKAYIKRKSTKINQDECRKKRYILVQWTSLLGFNNNNTHTHIAYLRWFPSVWAWINFLSTKNGFFYSEFHSSKSGLNFSLVLWETMLWKWLQIMSTGGGEWNAAMFTPAHGTNKSSSTPAAFCWSADFLQYGSCWGTVTRENNKKSAKRSVMGMERNIFLK